ncbi:amidohydrolase family protein, partial [Candidatus Thioglobus sp.]|uniref:amidohydrolase family protein n=1 Tax=Candidatus Thioglobus sp. TaxID=2026721 RepID=UPI003241FCDA
MKMYKKSMINLLVSLAVGLGIVFSSAVWAKNPVAAVKNQDTNGDNKVSLGEWSKSPFIFKKIDFNGDGFITAEEFAKKWGIPMPSGGGGVSSGGSVADAGSLDESNTIIADVHMHPHPDNHPIDQLTWMNRNGVKWAGQGEIKGGRVIREKYRQAMGNRFIPFGGQSALNKIYFKHGVNGLEDANNWMFKSLMNELEEDFASGKLKGIGEVMGNNSKTNPNPRVRRKTRIDAPTYLAMLDLVARYGGAMTMHVQMDEDSIEQLEVLADYNTGGNIIWAHCGNNSYAKDVRGVLQRHKNIYCDLSARHAPKLKGKVIRKRPHSEIFTPDSLDDSWKELIEEMPGRFMVGTDTKTEEHYDSGIENIRNGLLSNLSKETAEKVAYKNAQRLLDL